MLMNLFSLVLQIIKAVLKLILVLKQSCFVLSIANRTTCVLANLKVYPVLKENVMY